MWEDLLYYIVYRYIEFIYQVFLFLDYGMNSDVSAAQDRVRIIIGIDPVVRRVETEVLEKEKIRS
jgi:hypothetical protein